MKICRRGARLTARVQATRRLRGWVWIAVVGLALTAGCGDSTPTTDQGPSISQGPQAGQSPGPDRNQPSGPKPGGPPPCDRTITAPEEVSAALDGVTPGSTLCFSGGDFSRTDVLLTHSGGANQPITLVSDGATVRSIHVTGDHVTVEGFTVTGGDGIVLKGADLAILRNTVHDTQRGGITCMRCESSIVDSNTVAHADTVGIWTSGQRVTVSHNTVTGTVARDNGDADGMRFFGNGLRITSNTITDISDQGYANPPHPDCFQTYDSDGLPTYDVLIAGNTCRNVGAQCLIATGDRNANGAAPTSGPSISFVDNTCAANGAQAVNIRSWPNVEIRDNRISGPNVTRGIIIIEGSTGCVVIGNTTEGNRPTLDIDSSSQRGARIDHNTPG